MVHLCLGKKVINTCISFMSTSTTVYFCMSTGKVIHEYIFAELPVPSSGQATSPTQYSMMTIQLDYCSDYLVLRCNAKAKLLLKL